MQYPTEIKLKLNLFASFKKQNSIEQYSKLLNFFWGAVRLGARYNYGNVPVKNTANLLLF